MISSVLCGFSSAISQSVDFEVQEEPTHEGVPVESIFSSDAPYYDLITRDHKDPQ